MCTLLLHFAQSDAILKHELNIVHKAVDPDPPRTKKNLVHTVTQGRTRYSLLCPSSVGPPALYLTLYPVTVTVPEF